jgi:hypothetical protein
MICRISNEQFQTEGDQFPLTPTLFPAFADLLAEQVLWQARAASRRQASMERGIGSSQCLFFGLMNELTGCFIRCKFCMIKTS